MVVSLVSITIQKEQYIESDIKNLIKIYAYHCNGQPTVHTVKSTEKMSNFCIFSLRFVVGNREVKYLLTYGSEPFLRSH
jgi:hypothetical protein